MRKPARRPPGSGEDGKATSDPRVRRRILLQHVEIDVTRASLSLALGPPRPLGPPVSNPQATISGIPRQPSIKTLALYFGRGLDHVVAKAQLFQRRRPRIAQGRGQGSTSVRWDVQTRITAGRIQRRSDKGWAEFGAGAPAPMQRNVEAIVGRVWRRGR